MATLNGNNSDIFKDRSKMFAAQTHPCYRGNQLMIMCKCKLVSATTGGVYQPQRPPPCF